MPKKMWSAQSWQPREPWVASGHVEGAPRHAVARVTWSVGQSRGPRGAMGGCLAIWVKMPSAHASAPEAS